LSHAHTPEPAPGRDAAHPAEFGWPAWRQVLGRVYANIGRHHLSVVAAGVAFFGVLAIFPALAALVGLYGLIADPADVMANLGEIRPLLPAEAYRLIENQLRSLLEVPPQRLGFAFGVAMLIALWTARVGVSTLVEGLNIVYRETDTRNIILEFLASLALTALLLLIACAALLATVALPAVLRTFDFGPLGAWLAALGPLLIIGVAVVFVIGAIYRYGPHRAYARKRWVTWGALFATIAWVIASLLLSFYVSHFANFNRTYGSLGAIAALMFWFYVSAFVVLLGAELNAEMELQTARDTTTGAPRPIGERGAFVADHVA
jgi:membrane protein